MTFDQAVEFGAAFIAALVVGSLAEYFVHRLMHGGKMLAKTHAKHHQSGEAQGWWLEFVDYFRPGLLILWPGFLISWSAGFGFLLGGTLYSAMAAYAHQVQHENPELVFWLRRPVHHLHHKHRMWRHNFGIFTSVWDHVFRTYKHVEWKPQRRARDYPLRSFFQIKWL